MVSVSRRVRIITLPRLLGTREHRTGRFAYYYKRNRRKPTKKFAANILIFIGYLACVVVVVPSLLVSMKDGTPFLRMPLKGE